MNLNSENPIIGKKFQSEVLNFATKHFNKEFEEEVGIDIGNPPTPHKFDVVSVDKSIIIECKCYTWTESGNVPSAKLATLDEAILYMRSVTYNAERIIAMKESKHDRRDITLAEYFCDKKGHLMEGISVWEFDDKGKCRVLR